MGVNEGLAVTTLARVGAGATASTSAQLSADETDGGAISDHVVVEDGGEGFSPVDGLSPASSIASCCFVRAGGSFVSDGGGGGSVPARTST